MLLDDHHVLVTRKRLRNAIDIERLHGVARDHRNRFSRGFEAFGELHCLLHDDSIGQNAYVAAALDVAQLAEHPGVDRLVGIVRFARLADAQIDRPLFLRGAIVRRLGALGRVARRDDLHIGQRSGDGNVLLRMVCPAQRRVNDAGAHAHHGDGQVLIAQVVAHHLERSIEREGRDRVGERLAALERETGANSDHALLGDADVDEARGILLAELRHAAGRRDVGDHDIDIGIGAGRLVKRLGERIPHCAARSSSITAC